MSGGRPPKYSSEQIDQLLWELTRLGSLQEACKATGINYKAICSRRRRQHDLASLIHAALSQYHLKKDSSQ